MKKSFKHLLKQPLVWIYLAATAIGNTSFLYSVFSIFMLAGFAVFTGSIVGIVIGIGLLALHHSISKRFVVLKIGIAFSWMGIFLIMGLSVVGWFLIFHHVTFGLADMQDKKQILIQAEFKRIESSNEKFIESLRVNFLESYTQSVKQRSPKTAKEANEAVLGLANTKLRINKHILNLKLNRILNDNSFSNILLSYIQRFRERIGDIVSEVLLWVLALLLSAGIDVCGFAFNRVEKDIDNDDFNDEKEAKIEDDFEDDNLEFDDELNNVANSEPAELDTVGGFGVVDDTPKLKENGVVNNNFLTRQNGSFNGQKKTDKLTMRQKKIKKAVQSGKIAKDPRTGLTNKTHLARQTGLGLRTVQRNYKEEWERER